MPVSGVNSCSMILPVRWIFGASIMAGIDEFQCGFNFIIDMCFFIVILYEYLNNSIK